MPKVTGPAKAGVQGSSGHISAVSEQSPYNSSRAIHSSNPFIQACEEQIFLTRIRLGGCQKDLQAREQGSAMSKYFGNIDPLPSMPNSPAVDMGDVETSNFLEGIYRLCNSPGVLKNRHRCLSGCRQWILGCYAEAHLMKSTGEDIQECNSRLQAVQQELNMCEAESLLLILLGAIFSNQASE